MAGGRLYHVLFRKKVYSEDTIENTKFKRCLNRWDLAALGVGGTLGVGVYILVGSVAMHVAGPSIVLSFLIAAITALFAGLCYAEFSARVPKAGSAYTYTYVAVGEAAAFLVGWNIILEAVFGTASLARGFSWYIDSLTNNTISNWSATVAPIESTVFSPHFDFLSFGTVIVFGALLSIGVRASTWVNNVLVLVNVVIVVIIVIAGATQADLSNWYIQSLEVPQNNGVGGFFPYGVYGTLRGAAICFYAFVGFDILSFAAEETHEPRRTIPLTILSVLAILFILYTSVAIVVTMVVPYYELEQITTLATMFTNLGWEWASWMASAGAVFGILSGLFGALFPLPRLLYAMSADGLFLLRFDKVASKGKSPIVATVVSTAIISVISAILELEQLLTMVCIGTLLSYTFVAIGVIILRYHSGYKPPRIPSYWRQVFGRGAKAPSTATTLVVILSLALFVCVSLAVALVWEHSTIATIALNLVAFVLIIVIAIQPRVKEDLPFKAPIVPVIPCLSIYVNINLMVLISLNTWIRLFIWLAIGAVFYFVCLLCYKQNEENKYEDNLRTFAHNNTNGKALQVIVESPANSEAAKTSSNLTDDDIIEATGDDDVFTEDPKRTSNIFTVPIKINEQILQQGYIENNEEKEAKIIDLLDQVLQAEEDTYDVSSLKEHKEVEGMPITTATLPHRQSYSNLSDAGSDASLGNQGLSKYDVIAQVHREDLPKVQEDDTEEPYLILENIKEDYEDITAFNESETNSRTDESGYSDTFDLNAQSISRENLQEEPPNIPIPPPMNDNLLAGNPYIEKSYSIKERQSQFNPKEQKNFSENVKIPTPPPMDENFFASPYFKKSYTISAKPTKFSFEGDHKSRENLNIPVPPPIDENFFCSPNFKKSHTISARPTKHNTDEENKPRVSVQSNSSTEDGPMGFGSDRQMSFMLKLNNIFQTKISNDDQPEDVKEDEHTEDIRRRSHSAGNLVTNTEFDIYRERPRFQDLKKELLSKVATANLNTEEIAESVPEMKVEEAEEQSFSREDLKSRLEVIFANGGLSLLKPRLMKSNPPTPEEAYQTDTSSLEIKPKLPNMEKNDTLKRQKDKFSEVLNSFRLSFNKDDEV